MKLDIKGNKQISSSQVVEKFSYRLDDSAEAVALIAETLRKSYKNPIKTAIQEYLSNARDIHRELGVTTAIDVQLPTELNPEFFIRDYGSGLSKEGIQDYITFAKSTKRNSNIATGGFGFGSKSFFAYSDSFTIISYFEGFKYIYRASCVQNKEGALILISKTPTKEPNGLQVQVAVRPEDRKKFKAGVFLLKHYWTDQEINILNLNKEEYPKEPKTLISTDCGKVWEESPLESQPRNFGRYVRSAFSYSHKEGLILDYNRAFFLVDGIPYAIDNFEFRGEVAKFFNDLHHGYTVGISVATGVLTLSKYREYIETTPENQKIITEILEQELPKIKQEYIKNIGTPEVSNYEEFKKDDFSKYFMFSATYPCILKVGSEKIHAEMKRDQGAERISVTLEFSKAIPSWKLFDIYKERRNNSKKGYSIAWNNGGGYNIWNTSAPRKFSFDFTITEENKDNYYHSRFNLKNSYFTTESKMISNQRLETLCSTAKVPQCLFSFEKDPTQFELDFLAFFNIANLNSIERTIPEKKKPSEKPQTPKIRRAPKLKPTHKYNKISFTYADCFQAQASVDFHPEELKDTSKLLMDISKLAEINSYWAKKHPPTANDKYATMNKGSSYIKELYFWGISVIMVDEETYKVLIKDGNSWDFKSFDFKSYKKLPSSQTKRDARLKEHLTMKVSRQEEFVRLTRFVSHGLLSEEVSKVVTDFKEKSNEIFKKSGFYYPETSEQQKRAQELDKTFAPEIKNLMKEYAFLEFIQIPKYNKEYWNNCMEKTLLTQMIQHVLAGKVQEQKEKVSLSE